MIPHVFTTLEPVLATIVEDVDREFVNGHLLCTLVTRGNIWRMKLQDSDGFFTFCGLNRDYRLPPIKVGSTRLGKEHSACPIFRKLPIV